MVHLNYQLLEWIFEWDAGVLFFESLLLFENVTIGIKFDLNTIGHSNAK